ncbi:MAG: peptidoglycan editing factor PgeF [Treponema sp.]|nr:peptidoglycan editing factor PgeF [Treponema sp.]
MMLLQIHPFTLRFQENEGYGAFSFMTQDDSGITCLISSCFTGNLAHPGEQTNPLRERLYKNLGLDSAQVFACTQVHGQTVLLVDRDAPQTAPEADGMISRDPHVWLSVTVADCLPVFLYDTESLGFGIVHSGWKGTGIALHALRLMERHWGSNPENIAVILGPCIQACCYQVDPERAAAFEAAFGGPGGIYPLGPVVREVQSPEGKTWYLNLQAANARVLANAGVRTIAVCQDCTFTDERLGSFRREGPGYTRMTALIGYKKH